MSLENSDIPAVSSSPDRHTFQSNAYIERCKQEGTEPREEYLNIYKSAKQQDLENMLDPEWRTNNLEYDLRSTVWILEKARASDVYAQNLYAAMCNMQWRSKALWPTLKEENWSCSWRSSGGIVANMLQKGDYMDWYCSGIRNDAGHDPSLNMPYPNGYVPEGTVSAEIEQDLDRLGWIPIPFKDDDV
jgi:hypothetical protein